MYIKDINTYFRHKLTKVCIYVVQITSVGCKCSLYIRTLYIKRVILRTCGLHLYVCALMYGYSVIIACMCFNATRRNIPYIWLIWYVSVLCRICMASLLPCSVFRVFHIGIIATSCNSYFVPSYLGCTYMLLVYYSYSTL